MKKVLFASTALVAFAGAASADVALSGNAEMGIFNPDTDVQFFTDIDVTFTMSGETDGGLTFGAAIDIDETTLADGDGDATGVAGLDGILGTADDDLSQLDNGVGSNGAFGDNSDDGGIAIFISGGFGTLTMGDTDGALDWALTEVAFNNGSIADDETAHAGYNGNSALDGSGDGQILRYDNTFGDFGVAISAEQTDEGNDDDIVLGLGVKYTLDLGGNALNLGLGYQDVDGDDALGVSVNGSFGAVTAGISYLTLDDTYDHVGVGVGYTSGAISVSANYGIFDNDDGSEDDGFGLSVGYDLGGGAIVQFGYGTGTDETATDDGLGGTVITSNDQDTYSFGVRMNF